MRIYTLEDININEVTLKERYYDLFFKGQIDEAHQIIKDNPNLVNKVLSSEYFNLIISKILELENNYFNGVENTLEKHIETYNINIKNLVYLENFDNNKIYKKNNFVLYQYKIYFCIKDTKQGILPTKKDYWIELNLQGDKGFPNLDVEYKGSWTSSYNYQKNEMVVYDNKIYVSKQQNINKVPPNNRNDWLLCLQIENSGIIVSKIEPPNLNIGSIWFQIL